MFRIVYLCACVWSLILQIHISDIFLLTDEHLSPVVQNRGPKSLGQRKKYARSETSGIWNDRLFFYLHRDEEAIIGFHVSIPMETNCAPLVADLFLFSYEWDFMLSLSEDNQSVVIEAFNYNSRYLDDLLNINNNFFDSMVNRIYPSELQLNKANVSDTEASFLDLHLSVSDGFVKTKKLW